MSKYFENGMTVGDLKQFIKTLPNEIRVYMVTDRSDENWDEDNDRYRVAHPVAYLEKERIWDENDDTPETNLLLLVEEGDS